MARPVITPSQTPRNPKKTLRFTLSIAMSNKPLSMLRNVSNSNVEKVVYAPMKPIGIS